MHAFVLAPAHQAVPWGVSSWGADAVILDIGPWTHPQAREVARKAVLDILTGSPVPSQLILSIGCEQLAELDALADTPLAGVMVSGVEGPEQARMLEEQLSGLERRLGSNLKRWALYLYLKTPGSLWDLADVIRGCRHVTGVVLGCMDLAYDLTAAPEPSYLYRGPVPRFPAPQYVMSRTIYLSAALGIQVLGNLGLTNAPNAGAQKSSFQQAVASARDLGFAGMITWHREAVAACSAASAQHA